MTGPAWAAAIAFYGVGDVVTTHQGLQEAGVYEAHPIADRVLEGAGTEGMIAVKIGVFLIAWAAYNRVPEPHRVGIPLGLALLGLVIVANNINVIAQARASAGG